MVRICLIFSLFILFSCSVNDDTTEQEAEETPPTKINNSNAYLALGDSYTIGQSVPSNPSFPLQLRDSLTSILDKNLTVEIIATTGWRTDQLLEAASQPKRSYYDFVTLLIGVNNQYQNKPFFQYENEFPELLRRSITLAGNNPKNVIVVSIPDYAYTPFGQQENPDQISSEIDNYNAFAKTIAENNGVTFINITNITRKGLEHPELVANDGLHPSETAYKKFVELLFDSAYELLK